MAFAAAAALRALARRDGTLRARLCSLLLAAAASQPAQQAKRRRVAAATPPHGVDSGADAAAAASLVLLHALLRDAAADGAEALRMLQASFSATPGAPPPPDLLLTDVSMPVMGGLELARRFRDFERQAKPPGTPRLLIVALTAHVLESHVAECHAAGCDAHMGKPLRADSIAALRAQLAARRTGA